MTTIARCWLAKTSRPSPNVLLAPNLTCRRSGPSASFGYFGTSSAFNSSGKHAGFEICKGKSIERFKQGFTKSNKRGLKMASNRELWPEFFNELDFPAFPCPSCSRGRLVVDSETYSKVRSGSSDLYLQKHGYSPDEDFGRFTCIMVCSSRSCREVVTVCGNYTEVETYGSRREITTATQNWPRFMEPAPPLMDIPDETPREAAKAMQQSFNSFWGDRGSAANRLRISVERIMDAHSIPREEGGNELKLFKRIDRFAEKYAGGSKDTFDALRHVGNLGSHDGDVSREALLDAYEIYQEWLRNFYRAYPDRIKVLTERLIKSRGKY